MLVVISVTALWAFSSGLALKIMIPTEHPMEAFLFLLFGVPGCVLLIASFAANRHFAQKHWENWDEKWGEGFVHDRVGWFLTLISGLLIFGERVGGQGGARVIVGIIGMLSLAGAFVAVGALRAA